MKYSFSVPTSPAFSVITTPRPDAFSCFSLLVKSNQGPSPNIFTSYNIHQTYGSASVTKHGCYLYIIPKVSVKACKIKSELWKTARFIPSCLSFHLLLEAKAYRIENIHQCGCFQVKPTNRLFLWYFTIMRRGYKITT